MSAGRRAAVLGEHLRPRRGAAVPAAGVPAGFAGGDPGSGWQTAVAPAMMRGLRVVELATVIAGPAACAVLADFGAEVIKIERPGGDLWRGDRAGTTPDSPWGGPHFAQNNRGKKGIVLDLKKPEHFDALKRLLKTADVFVTNVRPRALKKMGLDYEALHKEMPRLIYAILTAWGLRGPRGEDPGYDVGAFWAASGLQDFSKPTDGGHVGQFPPGIGDHMTSMQVVAGVGLALWHREKTGQGQLVEASLLRSGVWGMGYPLLNTALNPESKFIREPRTNHYRPTFNVYKCKDGVWLQLLGLDIGRFDKPLCGVLGLDHAKIVAMDGAGRIAEFDRAFITQTSTHWEQALKDAGVWYQRAVQLDEVLTDPQVNAIGTFHKEPGLNYPLITSPLQLSCSNEHAPKGPPPACGQHTIDVLKGIGYSASDAEAIHNSTEKWKLGIASD